MLDFVRSVAAIAGVALLALAAHAQRPADPAAILRTVSEKYIAARQFEVKVTVRIVTRRESDGAGGRDKTVSLHTAFAEPGKYLIEMPGDVDSGSDGVHAWTYSPSRNQYWTGAPAKDDSGLENAKRSLDPFRYTESMTAKLLREEKIGTADCYVIEVHDVYTAAEGELAWVDKSRLVILRQQSSLASGGMLETSTADYSSIRIDEPLPDSLFQFTPPEGAKRVESIR